MRTRLFGAIGALIIISITACTWEQVTPRIDCSSSPVQVELLVTNESSCGSSNGSFAVNARGGEAPYEFTSEVGTNTDGVFANIGAGSYIVTVTDAKGCSSEISVLVENEDGVNLSDVTVANAGCGSSNGSINIDAVGGVEPYTFSLNGNIQSNNVFSGLSHGTYTVGVKDQSGCEITQNVKISSGVSYEQSIKSIIQGSCAVSGCHNGSVSPDLRSFNNIQASANSIKSRTASRSMPRGSTLSQQEIDLIACWVEDGAQQN